MQTEPIPWDSSLSIVIKCYFTLWHGFKFHLVVTDHQGNCIFAIRVDTVMYHFLMDFFYGVMLVWAPEIACHEQLKPLPTFINYIYSIIGSMLICNWAIWWFSLPLCCYTVFSIHHTYYGKETYIEDMLSLSSCMSWPNHHI